MKYTNYIIDELVTMVIYHCVFFQVCGDDEYCLFDIAATGDINIGVTTKESEIEQEAVAELFIPSKRFM